jgi:hypothetical protein
MFPTRHAIQRFQQRVAAVSTAEAARRIRATAESAKVRPKPRWWTPVAPAPGLLFLYPADLPGVCLLVRDGAVITVYERSQCRAWAMAGPLDIDRSVAPVPYHRASPGAQLAEAA